MVWARPGRANAAVPRLPIGPSSSGLGPSLGIVGSHVTVAASVMHVGRWSGWCERMKATANVGQQMCNNNGYSIHPSMTDY